MAKDMTVGSPAKTMLLFTLPMVAGNLFQQMYNVVDSMIVGNFVGSDALGAVGVTSSVTFLFVALATGASLGASVVISQLYGAKELQRMQTAIVTTLWSVLVLALVLEGLGLRSAPGCCTPSPPRPRRLPTRRPTCESTSMARCFCSTTMALTRSITLLATPRHRCCF